MQTEFEEETTVHWLKEAQKGYIRVAALILLNKKPAHGYEIMKEIKDKTNSRWRIPNPSRPRKSWIHRRGMVHPK
jgi:DNA-binding PadR family transcriptional regulator